METSIAVHAPAATPLHLAVDELAPGCEPLAARRPAAPAAWALPDEQLGGAVEAIALEDGGVALALDACDDLAPQWLAWMEWVDGLAPDRQYGPAT